MLRILEDLVGYAVSATDGNIGTVVNFLMDDENWVLRYLVVDTGGYLGGLQVLIPPTFFREADWSTHRFHVALTMDKVKKSPNVDSDKPVCRQHEMDFYRYYGYDSYWGPTGAWNTDMYPPIVGQGGEAHAQSPPVATPSDVHLQSAREVCGYSVEGTDDTIGHIQGFIVDDQTWAIRYFVVDTSGWWFGKKVLIAPHWARAISWKDRTVSLDMGRTAIKACPKWEPTAAINRAFETRLYDYYGRPVYWHRDTAE